MSDKTCDNCGAGEGLHHWETRQCPVGGMEAPIGRRQEWADTRFDTSTSTIRALRRRAEQAEQIDHARLLKLLQTIWDEAEHLSVFYNGEMQWAVDALAAYRETEQS